MGHLPGYSKDMVLFATAWKEVKRGNPFDVLGELLEVYSVEGSPAPIPLVGGAVGYFSYDLCHFIERLPTTAVDDLLLPECYLAFYDAVVAFDHREKKVYLATTGFPELEEGKRIKRAEERLKEIKDRILRSPPVPVVETSPAGEGIVLKSNFSREEYLSAVATAREYICAGDIFQVNLSQRFEADLPVPPYHLYQRLRLFTSSTPSLMRETCSPRLRSTRNGSPPIKE